MNVNKPVVNNASPKMANRFMSDKKELEKYLKVFSQKTVQAIVQARLGEKIQTFSNPRSLSNDWVSFSNIPNIKNKIENHRVCVCVYYEYIDAFTRIRKM